MKKKKELWEKVIHLLKRDLPEHEFSTWFANTSLKKLDNKSAVVEVPNKFVQSWIRDNYIGKIQSAFGKHLHFEPEIILSPSFSTSRFRDRKKRDKKAGISYREAVNPYWSFDNFIVTQHNKFAYSSSFELADNDFCEYNQLYIYGKQGMGKTHLLNAVANHIIKRVPSATVSYLPAETLCSHRGYEGPEVEFSNFISALSDTTCLLLDNIHLLGGFITHQKALVYALDQLYERKIRVAAAGRKRPGKIPNMLPELISRLEWGIISEIKDYDQRTKAQIIWDRARMDNLELSENTVFFISNNTDGLAGLESYFSYNFGSATKATVPRDLNLYSIKSLLNIKKASQITIHQIQKATAVYFNISQLELLSNKKNRTLSYPRQLAMYLSREFTGFSYKDIGKAFGDKNHSTVIYAMRRIKEKLISNRDTVRHINELTNLLC